MARRTSLLYRLARLSADADAIQRGPSAVERRARNKLVGRALGRAGVWGVLWGGGRRR